MNVVRHVKLRVNFFFSPTLDFFVFGCELKMRIAIIGAGIMGITTAFSIKEAIQNSIITVYADEYSPYTTSDVSAGYWEPFCLNDENSLEQKRVLYVLYLHFILVICFEL